MDMKSDSGDWIVIDYNDRDTWPNDDIGSILVREVSADIDSPNTVLETLRIASCTFNELERGRVGLLEWKPFDENC